jgi:hypothetical protein
LTADCDTTVPLVIPDGVTLDGGGHTITAHDPVGGFFSGAVVSNAGPSMTIQNLHIVGSFPTAAPGCGRGTLFGIHFNDASGTVSNVTVAGISEHSGCNSTTGIGIRADGVTAAQTVTITGTTVTGYQRNGVDARGSMTMNVSGSTIGPPEMLNGVIAQNGVVYVGNGNGQPGGTVSGNTIFGSGDAVQNVSTDAVLLIGAKNVTITNNVITSDSSQRGTDIGIFVLGDSTGVTISFNKIGRANADTPDPDGIGVYVERTGSPPGRASEGPPRDVVDTSSQATLICNTFSGWNHNVVGAMQIDCTPLPGGTECVTYSASTPSIEGGTLDADGAFVPPVQPITWKVTAGSLPPGLTMTTDGAITGTPTQPGAFTFTVQVTDSSAPPLTATTHQSIAITADCTTTTTPGSGVAPDAVSQNGLARTGLNVTPLFIGLFLVTAGGGLVLIANRRRHAIH